MRGRDNEGNSMGHLHKLYDFVVVAYIVHGGKALLIKHKKLNAWLPIGGHIELDEDPEEALLREVREECGLKVRFEGVRAEIDEDGFKSLLTPAFLDNHLISGEHRHIGLTYFGVSDSNEVELAEREHNDIRWFSAQELSDPRYDLKINVAHYAKEALKRLGS